MFKDCPDSELEPCHTYELGRESAEARTSCANLRSEIGDVEQSFDSYRKILCYRFGFYMEPLSPFMLYPEWPEQPYLSIGEPERKRRIECLDPIERETEGIQDIFPGTWWGDNPASRQGVLEQIAKELARSGWPMLVNPNVSDVVFRIDWRNYSDREILQSMGAWLKKYRPDKHRQRTHQKTGSGSRIKQLRADLKALGALRLLKIYRWDEIPEEEMVLYKSPSGWDEARNRAEKLINSFPFTRFE
jgi:hypothetical protein